MTPVKISLFVALLVVSTSTIGAAREFQPIPSQGQRLEYKDGKAFVIYEGDKVHFGVHYIQESSKAGWLAVIAQNISQEPFNISENSFTASSSGTPLKVYTYNEIMKKEKNRQAWIAVANGIAAGANSYSASMAGNNYNYGTYNSRTTATVNTYGTTAYGTANTNGSYSGYSYNAGAAYAAQSDANRKNQEMFDRSAQYALATTTSLEERTLKANTISPNEVISGQIKIDLPKKDKNQPAEFVIQVNTTATPIYLTFREVL